MRCKVLAVAAVVMACMVGRVQAQTVTFEYTSDQSAYSASIGSTVTVNLYLTEILTGGAHSIIGPNGYEYGLTGAALSVNQVSATVGTGSTIATASNNTNAYNAATPGFGTNNTNSTIIVAYNGNSGGAAGIATSVIGGGNPANVPAGTQVSSIGGVVTNSVLVGTITITVAAGTTKYQVTSPDTSPAGSTDQTGDQTNTSASTFLLDQDGSGTVQQGAFKGTNVSWIGTEDPIWTFTVTPSVAGVPEPSSMLLCGVAISGLGVRAWRRRRGQATETEPEPTAAV